MTNVQLQQLLKHEVFLRSLARRLLRDTARADDVVQDTWIVALKSDKRPDEVRRGWLAGIVRNLVRRTYRTEERRTRRERVAARMTDDVEPFLLRSELLVRTPRGRMATAKAYNHLKKTPPKNSGNDDNQSQLFD